MKFDLQSKADLIAAKELQLIKKDEELASVKLTGEQLRAHLQMKDAEFAAAQRENASLKMNVEEERQRCQGRERDIEGLETVFNEVKENIGREFHAKCREYDTLRVDFSKLTSTCNELKIALQ